MIPSLFRGTPLVLTAAAGLAFAPAIYAQSAATDQAVRNETVHSDSPDRHLAPHDTFYTMEYASARTDKGVEGFPPGTEVRLVSVDREARTLTVTNGRASVELPPDKLTNDVDIAGMVRAQDAANQERVARYQQAESAAYQKYQQEVAEYTAKDLEKRQQAIREAEQQRAEQVATNHTTQTVDTSSALTNSNNNGYYNQGGLGYGSPYGYFIDTGALTNGTQNNTQRNTGAAVNGSNGKGAVSSTQNGTQSGNSRTGGATSGSSSSAGTTGGGSAGGKGPK